MNLQLLKQGPRKSGIRQCYKALMADEVQILFLAEDAREELLRDLKDLAGEKGVPIEWVPTMKELASMAEINVNTAASVLLK